MNIRKYQLLYISEHDDARNRHDLFARDEREVAAVVCDGSINDELIFEAVKS